MNPQPIGVRVLVKALDDESRVWVPDSAVPTRRGVILEKGEEARYLNISDEVLFVSVATNVHEFTHNGERLYVMPEGAVLVVLDRAPVAF